MLPPSRWSSARWKTRTASTDRSEPDVVAGDAARPEGLLADHLAVDAHRHRARRRATDAEVAVRIGADEALAAVGERQLHVGVGPWRASAGHGRCHLRGLLGRRAVARVLRAEEEGAVEGVP